MNQKDFWDFSFLYVLMSRIKYENSKRPVYHTSFCAQCIFEVAKKYYLLTQTSDNEENFSKEEILNNIQLLMKKLSDSFKVDRTPNRIANDLFLYAAELGNSADPWKEIRENSNKIAHELVPLAKNDINKGEDFKSRLFSTIIWSIVGNNIDFGTAGHDPQVDTKKLHKIYDTVKIEGFKINHFDCLFQDLNKFQSCLYILDNAGEIVFDKLVIEELIKNDIEVIAVVKGNPISNDAILSDAISIGLDKVCKVITTGSPNLGFDPQDNSEDFLKFLNEAKIVIAKGQANWEATYAFQEQLTNRESIKFYNIFKCKCEIHANLLGFPIGSNFINNLSLDDYIDD